MESINHELHYIEICFDLDVNCKNLRVEWLSTEGLLIECDKDNCLRVAPDPYALANGEVCIEGWVHCDDCITGNSAPKYFKKCFCNAKSDCPEDCEICKKYGEVGVCEQQLTQKQIKEGRLCNGDCPPNKPFFDPILEKCVECRPGSVHPNNPCVICVNGEWTEKCENCDDKSGDCKECLSNTDCSKNTDGRNCCNPSGSCDCCPGYVYDYTLKKCVLVPECNSKDECKECEDCVEILLPDGTRKRKCLPIECPEGTKCWKGKCIPWNCLSTSCDNGADCGPDCGCIEIDGIKQCVPCAILECTGQCQEALGCRCNDQNECEGIPDCDQFCDGSNPCLDPRCTCYNERCVDCANFPCIGPDADCNSYYNCGCNNQNECEGGKGCNDSVEITQDTDCSGNFGCSLTAKYISSNKCMCDPIEFRIKNTKSCIPNSNDNEILKLNIEMFKAGLAYKNYKSNPNMGDNELVSGSISVVIKHYQKNNLGNYIQISALNSSPLNVAIQNNAISDITLLNIAHIHKFYNGGGTKVEIEIFAKDVKISANDCVEYGTTLLRKFILNYETLNDTQSTCENINQLYFNSLSVDVTDTKSSKKPLFTWFKSNTDIFNNSIISRNKNYNKSGIFRKQYGIKSGNTWIDKISNAAETTLTGNKEGELWNNYNYAVDVNCSCKSNLNYVDELLYCCPNEYQYKIENCNSKFTLESFDVCDVNGKMQGSQYNNVNYQIPDEVKTKYKVKIIFDDGTNEIIELNHTTNTKVSGIVKDYISENKVISNVSIFQYYSGGLLNGKQCETILDIPEIIIPDIKLSRECETTNIPGEVKMKITSIYPGINISSISYFLRTFTTALGNTIGNEVSLTPDDNQTKIEFLKSFNNTPNNNVTHEITYLDPNGQSDVLVRYQIGNCKILLKADTCLPSVNIKPETPNEAFISSLNCPGINQGLNVSSLTTGFNILETIDFSLSGSHIQTINNQSGLFNNLPPGNYTITASQGNLTAFNSFTIDPRVEATAELSDNSICQNQFTNIIITGAIGATFNVINPNGGSLGIFTINNSGSIIVPNIGTPGNYNVVLLSDPTLTMCSPWNKILTLSVGGQNLQPQIELQSGTYCVGQPIPFRIVDGGVNAVYNLTSNGTGSITTPLQANNNQFNGEFIPSTSNFAITVLGTSNECNNVVQTTFNGQANPEININATSVCQPNNTVTVTVNLNVQAQSVFIGNVSAINTIGNTWVRSNISGNQNTTLEIVVNSNGCQKISSIEIQNCACPSGTLQIVNGQLPCGQGNVELSLFNTNLQITTQWQYVWEELINNQWFGIGSLTNVPVNGVPSINVGVGVQVNATFRLRVVNTLNNCIYNSNQLVLSANPSIPQNLTILPSGPIQVNQPVVFETGQGYASYQWGGAVSGNTFQSNSIIFNQPQSNVPISVTVCSDENNNCCNTFNTTINVIANCLGFNLTTGNQNLINSCLNSVIVTGFGGTGLRTYTISSDYIQINTPTPVIAGTGNQFTIPVNTSVVPIGVTTTITVVVTDSIGCTETFIFEYERCQTGCNCEYELKIVDKNTLQENITSFVVQEIDGELQIRSEVTAQIYEVCEGVPLQLIHSYDLALGSGSNGYPGTIGQTDLHISLNRMVNNVLTTITEVDLIINNVATTVNIPTSFNGGNPQTDTDKLVEFLNDQTAPNTFIKVPNSHIIRMVKLSNTNIHGFDNNIGKGYIANNLLRSYGVGGFNPNRILTSYITSCANLEYHRNFNPITSIIRTITYNNIIITNSPEYAPGNNQPDHNPLRICSGCQPV